MSFTSIQLRNETKESLKEFKIHPNQSYEEVVEKLILFYKENHN